MHAKVAAAAIVIGALCPIVEEALAQMPDIAVRMEPVNNFAGHADPDFPDGVVTYDIFVDVAGECGYENDWQSFSLRAILDGVSIYHHPLSPGLNPPPGTALFDLYPGLEFKTYICSADPDLSDSAPPADWRAILEDSALAFRVDWGDIRDTGNGAFAIGRLSLLPYYADWSCSVEGDVCAKCTDCEPWQALLLPLSCPADLNGDDVVDLADLAILLGSYGVDGGGDEDGDGDTDLADLATLLAEYGCE